MSDKPQVTNYCPMCLGYVARIAELEARWEKLRNYVETMKTANQCGALAAWGTCRAMLEKMTELERTKQRTGLNES